MVFERLGPSLYDFLRRNGYKPFPLAMVSRQLRGSCTAHVVPRACLPARLRHPPPCSPAVAPQGADVCVAAAGERSPAVQVPAILADPLSLAPLFASFLQAQSFARQLLESVAFMHELQLVHTDLKPGYSQGWRARGGSACRGAAAPASWRSLLQLVG